MFTFMQTRSQGRGFSQAGKNNFFTAALALAALGVTGMAIGCGGGGGGSQSAAASPSGQVQLTVTPTKTTVAPLAPVNLTATVSGTTETAVTWTVDGVTGGDTSVGAITGSGNTITYTAPALPGAHTVAAVSTADSAVTDAVVLTVQQGAASGTTSLATLSPGNPTAVGNGGHLTFSATMTGATGDSVTWSVDGINGGNSAVGTISAAGVYTCPSVSASTIHTITATSVSSPGISASVPVLATVSNTTINAKTQYGATGNGSTNDTAAISNALSASGNGICYLPAGTYMINPTANGSYGLNIPAGATLLMDPGATLKCITQTTSGDYNLIRMGATNIAVVGGAVVGDRVARNLPTYNDGSGTDFESGNGFAFSGYGSGTNMIALGVAVSNNCDDGFYLYNGANGVTIWGCTSDNNRRQGLSIVYGNNILIKNCKFTNTNGQDPGNGLDLEPSGSGQTVTNVQILDSTFTGNKGGGIQTDSSNASVNNITISGNTLSGNGGQDYGIGGMYIEDGASYFTVTNNTITGNLAGGNQGGIRFDDCTHSTISGNLIKNNAGYGIALWSASGTTVSGNTVSGNSSGTIYSDGSASVGSNTTN